MSALRNVYVMEGDGLRKGFAVIRSFTRSISLYCHDGDHSVGLASSFVDLFLSIAVFSYNLTVLTSDLISLRLSFC